MRYIKNCAGENSMVKIVVRAVVVAVAVLLARKLSPIMENGPSSAKSTSSEYIPTVPVLIINSARGISSFCIRVVPAG